jgi:beta-aspartyl-peptidase (threonine type)
MPERGAGWSLIVHGGAKPIAPGQAAANRAGCLAATIAGAAVLRDGGSAVDAVVAAIHTLEDDPTFNAGRGSVANADGEQEMDAALMDGATLDFGAVAAVRRLRNPIEAAHAMLRAGPTLLVGPGAERFAAGQGIALLEPGWAALPAQDSGHDTVGCVVRDANGRFAAGTSTGGLAGTEAGRVGDSPLAGCGLYADDLLGAVSLSGDGESIMRTMLAARVMSALGDRPASAAARSALDHLRRVGGEAGAIVIDRDGRPGIAHNSSHFALGFASARIEPRAGIHHDELKDLFDDD